MPASKDPSASAARPRRSTKAPAATVDAIVQRVLGAILSHQLPPGTQLVEERLAAVFHVSRTKVRQALARLAHDGIVTVIPNRGAFVSSPTVEEARALFEARRVIEPPLARKLAASAGKADIERLRAHVRLETKARAAQDTRGIIGLSGEFHEIIAEMAGNPYLARTLRELESLTRLVIILYDAPNAPSCTYDEHSGLIDAIASRDGDRAAALMVEHLDHVEASLDLEQATGRDIDLEAVFA